MSKLKSIPIGAWVALAVLIASVAAIVIWAPPAMWASLAAADPEHIAGVIGLVGSAIAGVVTLVRAAWTGEPPPPAITADLEPGVKSAPTRDVRIGRRGFSDVLELVMIVVSAIGAAGLLALSGCTVSAAQTLASAQAEVHVAHQAARVTFYEAESARCRAASPTFDAWEECMVPAVAVQRTADTYRDALHSAQATIDAVGAENAQGAIACAVVAAGHFARSLETAGAPVPAEVLSVAAIVVEVPCG